MEENKRLSEWELLHAGVLCQFTIGCVGCPIEAKFRNRPERAQLCKAASYAAYKQALAEIGGLRMWEEESK